ncbi:MAG: hypothetical protein M9962_06720 [Oligoflexia bacterium]|nr:hypothetical protein [Oligoflexia bacterium]
MSDLRSVNNNSNNRSNDNYIEQLRQKIGTGFSDQKIDKKTRNEMGKDDFVKLMTAQLKHQDPINPMKNEQMAAQLAQFSALEQMVNMNKNIEQLAAAQKPSENVLAASLIGKRIVTDKAKFAYEKGSNPELKFDLPDNASNVNVSVVNDKGEIVREISLSNMMKGPQSIKWDGKNDKNQEMGAGEFSFKITAVDDQERPMQIKLNSTGLVSGVVFEGGKALLIVDDKKIPIDAVGRIENDKETPTDKQAMQASNAQKTNSVDEAAAQINASESEKNANIAKNFLPLSESSKKIDNGGIPQSQDESMNSDVPYPLWNPSEM